MMFADLATQCRHEVPFGNSNIHKDRLCGDMCNNCNTMPTLKPFEDIHLPGVQQMKQTGAHYNRSSATLIMFQIKYEKKWLLVNLISNSNACTYWHIFDQSVTRLRWKNNKFVILNVKLNGLLLCELGVLLTALIQTFPAGLRIKFEYLPVTSCFSNLWFTFAPNVHQHLNCSEWHCSVSFFAQRFNISHTAIIDYWDYWTWKLQLILEVKVKKNK